MQNSDAKSIFRAKDAGKLKLRGVEIVVFRF